MLIDGPSLPSDTTLDADLLIIGAGPVGLAIAFELSNTHRRVVVVETGGDRPSSAADQLSAIEFDSPDFPSPQSSRSHRVGGMAATWNTRTDGGTPAAKYLPLDPVDFEERSWVPSSGWPLNFTDLLPYFARARDLCGIPPFD